MIATELLPDRNCGTCTAAQKLEWGCNGNAKLPVKWKDEELHTCPRRPILDDPLWFGEVFRSYRNVGRGFLPEEGRLESQPNALVECWNIIDRALDECDEVMRKEDKKKKRRRG